MVFGHRQEKITVPTPEEMLKKHPAIKEIILPKKGWLIHNNHPIDDEKLTEALINSKATFSGTFKGHVRQDLQAYLNAPVIKTKFKDNYHKYDFEETIRGEFGEAVEKFYKSNRLNPENIRHTMHIVGPISAMVFWSEPKLREYLLQETDQVWNDLAKGNKDDKDKYELEAYKKMSQDEQEVITSRLADLVKEICIGLIDQYSSQK